MPDSTPIAFDLIYDVGMHNGDDTAFYLHQGFRVVAIEADPQLVEAAMLRFSNEIKSGRLTILNLGIAEGSGTGTFWVSDDLSVRNSFQEQLASRDGARHHSIEIRTRRFSEILDQYGIPFYLKVDIEGNDFLCLRDLTGKPLPQFISVEAECVGDDNDIEVNGPLANLSLLYELGYTRFKLIGQSDLRVAPHSNLQALIQRFVKSAAYGRIRFPVFSELARLLTGHAYLQRKHGFRFAFGSSGAWGDGTPGRWLSLEQSEALYIKVRNRYSKVTGADFWYDWHATVSNPRSLADGLTRNRN
jgi:FkbM family methyltransferase